MARIYSPFKIVIIEIDGHKNDPVRLYSNDLYEKLTAKGIEVILDDRNAKLGNKLNDWELIGIPNVVIVGKSEAESNSLTFKKRGQTDKASLSIEDLIKIIKD